MSIQDQDDFQFRPLTEGLGFHKNSTKADSQNSSKKIEKKSFLDMDMAVDLTSPLPRKNFDTKPATEPVHIPAQMPTPGHSTVDEILKTLNQKKSFDFIDKTHIHQKAVETFKTTRFDLSAALLDTMLITAGSLACLIILLLVTNVDLFANLYHPDSQGLIYLSLITLAAGVSWVYMVAHRVYLGYTPGEWVFDQRLGKPEDMGTASYAMKTAFRMTVIIATGYLVFPILSALFNKDVLGRMMNLELMRKV